MLTDLPDALSIVVAGIAAIRSDGRIDLDWCSEVHVSIICDPGTAPRVAAWPTPLPSIRLV